MTYVRLDSGVLDSTLWVDRDAREIFITALLMAIPYEVTEPIPEIATRSLEFTGWKIPPGWYGKVEAAGVGIIRRAGITDEDVGLSALERLACQDQGSRSHAFEGRRLVRVDGGFIVLNFISYRDRDSTNSERQQRYRERQKALKEAKTNNGKLPVTVTAKRVTITQQLDNDSDSDSDVKTTLGYSEEFDSLWKAYPKRSGGNSKADAYKNYRARLREGVPAESLLAGVERYAAYIRATRKEGSEYVKLGATFFGPSRHWEEPWTLAPTTAVTERNGKPGSSLAAAELIQRVKRATVPNPYGGGMQLTADWQSTFSEPELRVIRAITPGRILNDPNEGTLVSQVTKALGESHG